MLRHAIRKMTEYGFGLDENKDKSAYEADGVCMYAWDAQHSILDTHFNFCKAT